MDIGDSAVEAILERHPPEKVIEQLSSHISDARRHRIDDVLGGRLPQLQVAIEEPYDPHNASAVVRSAEALGAVGVHVVRAHRRVLQNKGTTAGSSRWIRTFGYEEHGVFVERMKNSNVMLAGSCLGAERSLEELPADRPICLVFGNEHRGLSEEMRAACDTTYEIPMYGFAESYNLSVSAALSLYSLSSRMRAQKGSKGGFSESEIVWERARYFICAVDPRLVQALF